MTVLAVDLGHLADSRLRSSKQYEVKVWLAPADENGMCAAIAAHLPGVASCGATEAESLTNFREAFQASVESYLAHGKDIPWQHDIGDDAPEPNCSARWLVINVETPNS